jgi:hypothetical protein
MPSIYKSIAQLPVAHWITTNYDPFLRYALAELTKEPHIEVVGNSDTELRAVLGSWSSRNFGVYLHGRCFNYESLIYNTATYSAMRLRPEYSSIIKRMFLDCSVLAYGFSCTDQNFLEILNFIANQLGGATQRQHFLITSDPAAANLSLLRKVNFRVCVYSRDSDHEEGKNWIRKITHAHIKPVKPAVLPISQDNEFQLLASILLSIQSQSRDNEYAAACAALAVRAAQNKTECLFSELKDYVGQVAHVDDNTASQMLNEGLAYLAGKRMITQTTGHVVFGKEAFAQRDLSGAFVESVDLRLSSYNSRYRSSDVVKEIIRQAVSHVMLAQGMSIARALINQEDVSSYNLESLVSEAISRLPRAPDGITVELHKSICEVLRAPDEKTERALFAIAHAAYQLERVFLNPVHLEQVGSLLKWKIYIDSNIGLRAISPPAKQYKALRGLFERCRRLGTPLAMLYPFVEEIFQHIQLVGAIITSLRINNTVALESWISTLPAQERSPILEWYFYECKKSGWTSYTNFLQKRSISSLSGISGLLKNIGIATEGQDIIQQMDTSARETLWDDLRKWRRDQSLAGRKLRRNEATQIEWMALLRVQNIRAWFLSQDGQLRRGLKSINKGTYAGYVMTATTFAHMLTELHWGEVDISGFSAMMWSMPSKSIEERAQDMVMRDVLATVEQRGLALDPETIRDHVDDYFAKQKPLISYEGKSSDSINPEDESGFMKDMDSILPKAVDKILDRLAAIARRLRP